MIVFDLDGTLSIVGDRIKYLQQKPKDWDSFYEDCFSDTANIPVVETFKVFRDSGHHKIKIVTGRRESVRKKTLAWLSYYGISVPNDDLHMRNDGDIRDDTVVKPELVKDFVNFIDIVFEDRDSMVKKWRELGLSCFQVAEGKF